MERSEMRGRRCEIRRRRPRISLRCIRATVAALVVSTSLHAAERPSSFVDAATVVPGLVVEMRYAGTHNFVGARIDGYERPVCLLTRPAAAALAQVQRDL